ncbi:uncharacterized protein LOC131650241 [Vicia villosa]|uniref:uncharacterized protein LOC131650241 n=1 Tax=Vicia villosa TaxID=3911 RepID=UPI00273A843F|nr:uncharacterized protein LOC131650241 [Vicia villosa]
MKARHRRNYIGLVENKAGVIVDSVTKVKKAVKEYFEAKFRASNIARPRLSTTITYKLSEQESGSLEEPFTREEIKQVVFEGNGDKSPGPDGFNLEFLMKCWDTVGDDIVLFIQDFHKRGKLSKAVTASFIALIPKYDTLVFGDGSWQNLCTLKAVLRGFEMASGLTINLNISKIYGVGIRAEQLEACSSFLGCKIDSIPFRFLGFTVGGNHMRIGFWKPILKSLRDKLSSWKGRPLSIGGRVTLINSVITNMPSYQFSFYKIPSKVLKDIISIQRNFLWNGTVDKSSIAWIGWKEVCKSKEEGGLGIKHVGRFNIALLSKWPWRMLNEHNAIWVGLLRGRYGEYKNRMWGSEANDSASKESLWWRDIMELCNGEEGVTKKITSRLGGGTSILFWKNKWIGNDALQVQLPILFTEILLKDITICRAGRWNEEEWDWSNIKGT